MLGFIRQCVGRDPVGDALPFLILRAANALEQERRDTAALREATTIAADRSRTEIAELRAELSTRRDAARAFTEAATFEAAARQYVLEMPPPDPVIQDLLVARGNHVDGPGTEPLACGCGAGAHANHRNMIDVVIDRDGAVCDLGWPVQR